eukprot:CFRG2110T1
MKLNYKAFEFMDLSRGPPKNLKFMDRAQGHSLDDKKYAQTDTLEELRKNSGVNLDALMVVGVDKPVTVCQTTIWEILYTREDSNSTATPAGLSFYAELRGQAIIVPNIKYDVVKGVYTITFTPHTPGTYTVLIRIDHARYLGDATCINEHTSFMLSEALPRAPTSVEINSNGNSRGAHVDDICEIVATGDHASEMDMIRNNKPTGEWVKVSCKSPDSDAARKACELGLVEFVKGSFDEAIPDLYSNAINGSWCQWENGHTALGAGVTQFGEQAKVWDLPYLDPTQNQRRHRLKTTVVVYHWPMANVTISYYSLTIRVRIPGWRMYDDVEGTARNEWPGSFILSLWAPLIPLTKMCHPSVFVMGTSLHPASAGFTDELYGETLRQLILHFKSGAGAGVPIIYRRTTSTFMNKSKLPTNHRCLFRDRLIALDRVALAVMEDEDIDILDWWSSSLGRHSASSDNRHFEDRRSCKGTKVQLTQANIWINKIVNTV